MTLRALPVLAITLACAACAPPELVQRVTALEQHDGQLATRTTGLEQKMARMESLVADVEANKAYTREMATKITAIRDRYARLLDEQNQRIDDGRREYLRALRAQRASLQQLIGALDRAIAGLEAPLPKAGAPPPAGAAPLTPPKP